MKAYLESGKRCYVWYLLLIMLIFVFAPVRSLQANQPNTDTNITTVKSPDVGSKDIKRVIVLVYPLDSLSSQAMEDIVTTELMMANIDVVSRQKRTIISAEQLSKKQQPKDKDEKSTDSSNSEEVFDITKIARLSTADAIVTITVLSELVQQNIFDNSTGRIKQVHSKQVVTAATLTIVGASDGKLLASGYADYDLGENIVKTASDMGKEIVKIVRK